jgi:hypothetical protein
VYWKWLTPERKVASHGTLKVVEVGKDDAKVELTYLSSEKEGTTAESSWRSGTRYPGNAGRGGQGERVEACAEVGANPPTWRAACRRCPTEGFASWAHFHKKLVQLRRRV